MGEIIEKIEALVGPELESQQVELVDLTYQKEQGGWTLCFFLDKPQGISLDDCETWSHRLGDLIDQAGIIQQRYVLEVSSPGVYRPLKKLKDFERFKGERVSAKLFAPMEGQKNFHGTLLNADENSIYLRLDEGREVTLSRQQVAKCKLDPVFEV